MAAEVNGLRIFRGVEQGHGMRSKDVFVYCRRNMKQQAQDWIRLNYGRSFRIKETSEYKSSVAAITPADKEHSKNLQSCIVDRLRLEKESQGMTWSYAQAAKGREDAERVDNDDISTLDGNEDSSTEKSEQQKANIAPNQSQESDIKRLETNMEIMNKKLETLLICTQRLEDAIMVLSDNEEMVTPKDKKIAQKTITSIKRKRRERQDTNIDSDASEEMVKRTPPRFRTKQKNPRGDKISKISDQINANNESVARSNEEDMVVDDSNNE